MAFAAWPGTVNRNALRDSYSEELERWNVNSFTPDDGPPLEAIEAAKSTDKISFELKLTAAEWVNLRTFWRTTLNSGVNYFTLANPLSGTTETYKFIEPPRLKSVTQTKYRASVALRRFN